MKAQLVSSILLLIMLLTRVAQHPHEVRMTMTR